MRIHYALKIFVLFTAFLNIAEIIWADELLENDSVTAFKRIVDETANWEIFTSNSWITALELSDDGETLWVGTTGGLEERDAETGHIKKNYSLQDGLPHIYITTLLSDGNGGVWVGTDKGGLAHLKSDDSWELFNEYYSELPDNKVMDLLPDGQGGIWIGTFLDGFAHFKSDGSWDVFDRSTSGLPDSSVMTLIEDGSDGLWLGTFWGGLAHFKADGSWDIYDEDNSELATDDIRSLLLDGSGGIWIGTYRGGLAHFKSDGSWEILNESNSGLPSNIVWSLIPDMNNGIWIGTGEGGLAHLKENGEWEVFDTNNSNLPKDDIRSILYDLNHDSIWVGTYRAGLVRLRSDSQVEVFETDLPQLPGNEIQSLNYDNNGGIWVGTISGLAHLRSDDTWDIFTENNSELPENYVNTLISDNDGGIWIGTSGGGLTHLQSDDSWKIFNESNSGLPDNYVQSLCSDNNGGVWAGTFYGGVAHLKSDASWEVFDTDNSELPDNRVFALTTDNNNDLWVGTGASGLAYLNFDYLWDVFNTDNSELPFNFVNALHFEDHSGIWIGTYGGGIAHLKFNLSWIIFNTHTSHLPSNFVNDIFWESNGDTWIATGSFDGKGGVLHLKSDYSWDVFDANNSFLPNCHVCSIDSDGGGGIWVGTYGGLAHLLLLGTPEQINFPDLSEITINWFLKNSIIDYKNTKYIELQRALSKTGPYETVRDTLNNPIRFYVDYTDCPNPRVDNCWPAVENHTPAYQGEGDIRIKGYTLDTPITDPKWLEGLPRYYCLSAVIEEDDELIRVANNSETTLMTPTVEENPRVDLSLETSAIALLPGSSRDMALFVSSLDLFTGEVQLETSLISEIPDSMIIQIDPVAVTLTPGETVSVSLHIEISPEATQSGVSTLQIKPVTPSGDAQFQSTALTVYTDDTEPIAALSIAHTTKRPRVMDGITVSGNILPVQREQQVIITGKNVVSGNEIDPLTLLTDNKGFFEGSILPENAGTLLLTAQSAGVTSNNAEIFILPARNHIALTSNVNQSTSKKDNLTIQGMITPVRPAEMLSGAESRVVNLDIRYLDPTDSKGGLKPQFVGKVDVDENGNFTKDIVVPGDGFIHVKASLSETSDFLGINTKLVIPIGQPVGEGIIVVSESGTAEFQDISKSLGAYVYNTLQTRNIPDERIRYLGLSDDGIEADGYADKNNIHHSLTEWAVSLISTDDPYETPLNLYLIGEIEEGNFRLNENETLSAAELDQYFDEAEGYLDGKDLPVTIVLEGAQSEAWIETISGKGRIILTSSSAKPLDQGGYAGYDNFGESSFSRYFYQFINYGSDIEGSFAEANYEILKFYRHTQRPVMDADGDGIGNTKYDRYEASGKFIEYRPSGNLRPKIRTAHPDMTITGRENNTLWAIATDPEQEMKGVFCSITDPSDRTRHLELRAIDYSANWYEIQLEKFSQTGCHQVVYYAKDKAGNVSLPVERFLHVTASGLHIDSDVVPQAPILTLTTEVSQVSVSWRAVSGADGYILLYAPYPDGTTIGRIDMGSQTSMSTFDAAGMAFYVAVQAWNANGKSELSNIEWFDLK